MKNKTAPEPTPDADPTVTMKTEDYLQTLLATQAALDAAITHFSRWNGLFFKRTTACCKRQAVSVFSKILAASIECDEMIATHEEFEEHLNALEEIVSGEMAITAETVEFMSEKHPIGARYREEWRL